MKYAVIDIETTGLDRYKDKIQYIGIGMAESIEDTELNYVILKPPFHGLHEMYETLRKGKYKLVYQNGNFDTLFIEVHHGLKFPIHHDTRLLGTAYDLSAEHGLKAMAKKYLKVNDWDIETSKKKSMEDSVVVPYLKKDLLYTWKLFQFFMKRMSKEQMKIYEELLLPAYKMYRKAERNGIYIDRAKLKIVTLAYREKERSAKAKLVAKHNINWNSPKQVQKALYEDSKLPVYKLSEKTGEPSADAKVLKRLSAKGYEIANLLLDYKFYFGANSKFLKSWEEYSKHDGRIHPSFNLTNVVTGRTSCSNPNLQQVPRNPELRSLFTAPKGRILIEADYSQIELRIASHYANEPTMIKVYRTGGDIHTETAKTFTNGKQPTKEERSKAKAVNFGFLYGMGAKGFTDYAFDSYGVIFSPSESEQYRALFFQKYSRLLDWHKEIEVECVLAGGISNLFGRFRSLPNIYSTNSYDYGSAKRQAINTPVQSTASDLLLASAIEIDKKLSNRYDLKIVGTIHDSIIMEAPEEYREELESEIKAIMSSPELLKTFNIKLKVPLEADVSFGPWGGK